MALHVSEMMLLTVDFPILKEKLMDCCESPVAKKRKVTASLSADEMALRNLVGGHAVGTRHHDD